MAIVTVQSGFGAPKSKICNCFHFPSFYLASLVAQLVKNQPAMWETWIWSLGLEDPLEKGMATHSSILVWRIPWTGIIVHGSQRDGHEWATFIICHEVMGLDAMILVFWVLSFKLAFSLSSFTHIKGLFTSSSLSAIRVVSFAYLRLLIFHPAILIPDGKSSSLAFS